MTARVPPRIYTLPLFPLNCVLFPQSPLQLHIFEERYKAMINACIEQDAPFGVVLIEEGEEVGPPARPRNIGCVARIVGVKRLEDGRMNILAEGEERFRILDYMEADLPYLVGRVEEVEDAPTSQEEVLDDLQEEVSKLFTRYLALLAERADLALPDVDLPEDAESLTYYVGAIAMMPPQDKQRLLELTDTRTRLEDEQEILREQIEALETQEPEAYPGLAENPRVLIASPVDLHSDRWQQYLQKFRN